jgi:uncharacterized protein (DUF1015 family)
MADIAPITPLRFSTANLRDLVAPPYDVISPEEREALAALSPDNVVRLILPAGEGDSKYEVAAKELARMVQAGVLVRDPEPAYYKYEQTFTPPGEPNAPARTRTGFLGLVRLVPFSDRIVLPHERTLSGPKEDRLKLFRATRTNLSPGFMLYRDPQRTLDAHLAKGTPITEFTTPDGIHHRLTKVADKAAVAEITRGVAASKLLIADGHHRYETALRYSGEVDSVAAPANGAHKYFMVFFANEDDPNLVVYPTHRHVHGLPSFSLEDLAARAADLFTVEKLEPGAAASVLLAKLGESGKRGPSFVACGRDGGALLLCLKPAADLAGHPVLSQMIPELRRTDVAVLHGGILESLLGITKEAQAAKTNLWYPQDARAALARVRQGQGGEPGDVLFLMNATPVSDVRAVAEAGEVMPQKSTFFYPKVLTGLCIHTLEISQTVHVPA